MSRERKKKRPYSSNSILVVEKTQMLNGTGLFTYILAFVLGVNVGKYTRH